MASTRATEVAEILWELKRAGKVATYTAIARRAGFSAGANGRAMKACLKTIRRDWPHLQWWRAISDDKTVKAGGEQEGHLKEIGIEPVGEPQDGRASLVVEDDAVMNWESAEETEAAELG